MTDSTTAGSWAPTAEGAAASVAVSAAAPTTPSKTERIVDILNRQLRPARELRIKQAFKHRRNAPNLVDDVFCPDEVFRPSLERPIDRRRSAHVAQIADLVRQLHQLGVPREGGGMQQRGSQGRRLRDARFVGENIGHGDRVVDVRAGVCALAALVTVLMSG